MNDLKELEEILIDIVRRNQPINARNVHAIYSREKKGESITKTKTSKLLWRLKLSGKLLYDNRVFVYSVKESEKDGADRLMELSDEYLGAFAQKQKIFADVRPNDRVNYAGEIRELNDSLLDVLNEVKILVFNNGWSMPEVESLVCAVLYTALKQDEEVIEYVKKRVEDEDIEQIISKEEALENYRVLCRNVLEDGIVTDEENEKLNKLKKELNITDEEAAEIFEMVSAELDYDSSDKLEEHQFRIDDTKIGIYTAELPHSDLFKREYNEDGDYLEIIVNSKHPLYNEDSGYEIGLIAGCLYFTSDNMTNPQTELFIQRIHQNMKRIERDI